MIGLYAVMLVFLCLLIMSTILMFVINLVAAIRVSTLAAVVVLCVAIGTFYIAYKL